VLENLTIAPRRLPQCRRVRLAPVGRRAQSARGCGHRASWLSGWNGQTSHDAGGIFHHGGTEGRVPGPDPEARSYGSFVSFSDPDGKGWLLQEIKTRLPGR
jgi:hypothetical protein